MKRNYLFISALIFVGLGKLSAQVNSPTFVELSNSVDNANFPMLYEAASAWGDYDNDNFQDLLLSGIGAAGCQTLLYKNNGGTGFTGITTTVFPGLRNSNATWLDYNNDGNLDLFLAGEKSDGSLYSGLWKNKGGNAGFEEVMTGTFPQISNGGGNKFNHYVVAADYDGDGWVDLYMQGRLKIKDPIEDKYNYDKNTGISYLYRNINGERFEQVGKPVKNKMNVADAAKPFIQLSAGSAAWADYNGDGFVDLLVAGEGIDADKYDADYGYHSSYNGAVYKNNGDGTFSDPVEFEGTEEGNAAWLDYDNNGKLDFVATGVRWDADPVSWNWRGDLYLNGAQGFTKFGAGITGLPNNIQPAAIDAGDVNNDGFNDLVYLNASSSDAIYLNNGGGMTAPMFTASLLVYDGQGAQRGGTANMVDFNNDGNLDAFLVGYGDAAGSHARLMKNTLGNGIQANQAPGAPTNLKVSTANDIAMFSWDAPTDDTTPQAALKYNLFIKQGDVIRMTIPADIATGKLKVSETSGAIAKRVLYKLSGLTGDYTWGVQAIDNSKMTSAFAVFGSGNGITEKPLASVKVVGEEGLIRVTSDVELAGVVNVYSIDGVRVYSESLQSEATIQLSTGIYLVNVCSVNGTTSEKVIVR